jgi:mono/diheme cytochrome c family protein
MSKAVIGVLAILLLAGAVQLIPVDRTNPAVTSEIEAPAEVMAVFERSCYDCHSNQTRWPWYSGVAPVSWVLARDVDEGREHLNFSRWGEYPDEERNHLARDIAEEVEAGEMPIKAYLFLHRDARVTAEETERLRQWAESLRAPGGE